ncbi:MAG TPA: hypothetical protein VGQ20_01655, partial [Acidimicrobiales bacterium]|nr:hypothetical protein [Acidimicrobiales bacterium]
MRSATDDVETAVTERTPRQWRPSPRVTFAISAAFALVSTALLILNLWVAHRRHAYTSDDVGLQTILHTWRPWNSSVAHVGEDTFVLKIPLYALAAVGFSPTRTTIFLTSVVMNLAGLALLGLAARFFLRRMPPSRHGFAHPIGISALWFVAIGGLVDLLLRPNIRNVELGLGLFALTSVVRLHDEWPSLARRAAYTRLATASVVLG